MSVSWENPSSGLPTRSETNRALQPQITTGLAFRTRKEEGLYYLCSENKLNVGYPHMEKVGNYANTPM